MARKSILVVDDEKNQREILETILSGEGYDVTTASSGEAAMKLMNAIRSASDKTLRGIALEDCGFGYGAQATLIRQCRSTCKVRL